MTGLNYMKNGQDPVAKKDEEYPEWLWSCLDVLKKSDEGADEGAGDEFCKSTDAVKLNTLSIAADCPLSEIEEATKTGGQATEGP